MQTVHAFIKRSRLGSALLGLGLLCSTWLWSNPAQAAEVTAGPMLGNTTAHSSEIWIQTDQPGRVKVRFWPHGNPQAVQESKTKVTDASRFITALIPLEYLKANQQYDYELIVNDKVQHFDYPLHLTTDPEIAANAVKLPDVKALIGSCYYLNDPVMNFFNVAYGGGLEIFQHMAKADANLMVWMGDNIYFAPFDLSNLYNMNQRYERQRQIPELQAFLAAMPHYATWDDHDFGPNNSSSNFWRKEDSYRLFKAYWANPRYGLLSTPGVFFNKRWGDAEFFFTDNRYYRDPNDFPNPDTRKYLGHEQLNWLKNALKSSTATFKFVIISSPVLDRYYSESFIRARGEFQSLLKFLDQEKINGVIFLSGDRHQSMLTKMDRPGAYPIFDYTSSPLTSQPTRVMDKDEANDSYRIPGSLLQERNYGRLYITGPRGQRVLTLEAYDTQGKKIWHYRIPQAELKYPQ